MRRIAVAIALLSIGNEVISLAVLAALGIWGVLLLFQVVAERGVY